MYGFDHLILIIVSLMIFHSPIPSQFHRTITNLGDWVGSLYSCAVWAEIHCITDYWCFENPLLKIKKFFNFRNVVFVNTVFLIFFYYSSLIIYLKFPDSNSHSISAMIITFTFQFHQAYSVNLKYHNYVQIIVLKNYSTPK